MERDSEQFRNPGLPDGTYIVTPPSVVKPRVCAKGDAICIPSNYSKFDLPNETLTTVNVGIDIKDIPKIDDKEFSITLNAFFVVRWTDNRMIIDQVSLNSRVMHDRRARSEKMIAIAILRSEIGIAIIF